MSTENWQVIAVGAMTASLPLLAWGGNDKVAVVAIVGAAIFAMGAITLTVLRFAPNPEE